MVIVVFSQGDIIRFNLGPSAGHEPIGMRPALVVSSFEFNLGTSMTLVCPITSRTNGFPLHFKLPDELDVSGFVATEQVRAYDLEARDAERVGSVPADFMRKVAACIKSFF